MRAKGLQPRHLLPGHTLKACALTRQEFQLEHYVYPGWFFKRRPRPLRLIESTPAATTYEDVIYAPTRSLHRLNNGCLYDGRLRRIDAACTWVGTNDICISDAPLHFEGGARELRTYDRPVLYLGHISRHHGHFLLETLARWWAVADGVAPEVDRFLIHLADRRGLELPFFKALLALSGIEQDQLVYFSSPVKLKEVIVPEPAFQERSHIYAAYREMWTNLLSSVDTGEANKIAQPLYVSKRLFARGSAKYLGEEKIEAYLESKGARIIHPQELSFVEQVRLFNEHAHIIGIAGSGMHNIIFSRSPKTAVYLTPPEIHRNHLLLDKCFNTNGTYLQACRMNTFLKSTTLKILSRARLVSETVAQGYYQVHQLDTERVIDWFENSGRL